MLGELRRRRLAIAVVSDCSAELVALFPTLPIAPLVDVAIFSHVTGSRKPEPANYLLACNRLGVAPADALFVGDGGSDELAGARAVGLRPIHLDAPDGAAGLVIDRHAAWTGERIGALAEVLAFVPAR